MEALAYYKDRINKAAGQRTLLQTQLSELKTKETETMRRLVSLEKALVVVQEVAKLTQEQLVYHIEDVVNTALETCFPGEYEFKLSFEIKRNKTEAVLKFLKDGFEVDPLEASGGGVVDIASFALRIAAWSLGTTRSTIILDEPMKFLSQDLQPRAGDILREISKTLGIQFIMVSHIAPIINSADRVFNVELKNRKSTVASYDA